MLKKVAGGLLTAFAVFVIIAAVPDIKRYIRISTM